MRTLPGNRDLRALNPSGIDPYQFPGLNIPDKLRIQGIRRNTLGCNHVPVFGLPDAERLDAQRVAERVDDPVDHDHDRIGPTDLLHADIDRILHRPGFADLIDQDLCDDLRIGRGREDLAGLLVFCPELAGIDEVAVVGDGDEMLLELEVEGLDILRQVRSGCRVTDMPDTGIAFQIR